MNDFLTNFGLYQTLLIKENSVGNDFDFTHAFFFNNKTFDYKCEAEGATKTFELEIEKGYTQYWGAHLSGKVATESIVDGKLNFTFAASGKCKSCKKYEVHFLLNVFSDNEIFGKSKNIYIQKVGALPQIKIVADKIISKYFDRETNDLYYKGINALNEKYGIGSFAYFRRIIEKELINIIEDIKSLPDSHSNEIQKLLDQHEADPKISTIYGNIFEHLPNSLKALGDNPIKLLYNQTSEGLHSLSESDCMDKAKRILQLLDFVIKKINEEKSDIKTLRETIKGLK